MRNMIIKIGPFEGKETENLYKKMVVSVIDVVAALTESINSRDYWYKMKVGLKRKGNQLSTLCRR